MLIRVDVQSENPFFLQIRDARPSDSVIVKKIDGLGPADVDLFLGEYARDGGSYNGRRVLPRTLIFHLLLNPNYKNNESVSGLRDMIYRAFLDPQEEGDYLNIILKDDMLPDRYLTGYTEKMEPDPFSQDLSMPITMVCPNPFLMAVAETVVPASGPSVPFTYQGSARAGVQIKATLTTSTNQVNIRVNTGKLLTLNDAFQANDQLVIDTRRGSRRIQVVRAGVTTDILYAKANTFWTELRKLQNTLYIFGATENSAVANLTEIKYRALWRGI